MKIIRWFAYCLVLLGIGLSPVRAEIQAGRDYVQLAASQPTQSGKKIEVIEFFWYGCPHCYQLEPYLKAWLEHKPKDVEFRHVPAIFRDSWVPNAKTFYALEALGVQEKLHQQVYDAIHLENLDLNNEQVLFDWMAKHGVDRKKFADAYNSFSMQIKVSKSVQMPKDYKLNGVPSLVVDGKYLTSGSLAGPPEDIIKVLDQLVEKARRERDRKP